MTPSKIMNHNQKPNQKKSDLSPITHLESAIGAATILAMQSQKHKYLFANDFEWLVIPPITLNQFKLFRENKENTPIGFVSWASINTTVEKRLLNGSVKLSPKDWNSGNNLWIIDVISPFVNHKEILQMISDSVFSNQNVHVLRAKSTGKGYEPQHLTDMLKNTD